MTRQLSEAVQLQQFNYGLSYIAYNTRYTRSISSNSNLTKHTIVWYASSVYKIMNVTIIIKEKQCGTIDTITGNVHFVISFCTC